MHTDQDEISTMVYELYLLARDQLKRDRKWIARLWKQRAPIDLSPEEYEHIFLLHTRFVRDTRARFENTSQKDALGPNQRGRQTSLRN